MKAVIYPRPHQPTRNIASEKQRLARDLTEPCGRGRQGKVMDIARLFLGCAKAARRQARARVCSALLRGCQIGGRCGRLVIVQVNQFPPAPAGCSRPALVAGLGISGVLGSVGSSRHTANRRGGRSACTTESRRAKQVLCVRVLVFCRHAEIGPKRTYLG